MNQIAYNGIVALELMLEIVVCIIMLSLKLFIGVEVRSSERLERNKMNFISQLFYQSCVAFASHFRLQVEEIA